MNSETMTAARLFLARYNMLPESIDIAACAERFLREMERGLAGEDSSLLMLPSYLTAEGTIPEGKTALAIDMGGTNMRVAKVKFVNSTPEISDFSNDPTPGSRGAITREQFLARTAERIAPLLEGTDCIGFCFSFPAEILPDHDARVGGFNKEVVVTGAENMHLGRELMDYLPQRKPLVVLNDTVATLLGGLYTGERMDADGMIGFILGTGMNACYLERTANIKKIGGGPGSMIVNIEAAGFNGFPLGEFERRADAKSAIPGDHLLEKVVSGAYQGPILYETLCQAARDRMFSEETCRGILGAPAFTSLDVDTFLRYPTGDGLLANLCRTGNDRGCMYAIIDCFFERAARLVTAMLAAVIEKTGGGRELYRPVQIAVEGSVFYKSLLLRGKLSYYMKQYVSDTLGRRSRFTQASDAGLLGAAAAALLNT